MDVQGAARSGFQDPFLRAPSASVVLGDSFETRPNGRFMFSVIFV
jgi:hypothetical protein